MVRLAFVIFSSLSLVVASRVFVLSSLAVCWIMKFSTIFDCLKVLYLTNGLLIENVNHHRMKLTAFCEAKWRIHSYLIIKYKLYKQIRIMLLHMYYFVDSIVWQMKLYRMHFVVVYHVDAHECCYFPLNIRFNPIVIMFHSNTKKNSWHFQIFSFKRDTALFFLLSEIVMRSLALSLSPFPSLYLGLSYYQIENMSSHKLKNEYNFWRHLHVRMWVFTMS